MIDTCQPKPVEAFTRDQGVRHQESSKQVTKTFEELNKPL